MLKVSTIMRMPVHAPKRGRTDDPRELAPADLVLVGHVHQVVFSPSGKRVVGYLVRRPDVAGMIRREDAFVALDSCALNDAGFVVANKDGLDDGARDRLGLDWDACILWTGMDAQTSDGKELGWVEDVEFSPKTGKVATFYVGDGSVAKSLVGNVEIPATMLEGYRKGKMIVGSEAANLALNGGLAAQVGRSYAQVKHGGKKAVEKGARNLGSALGKAKKHGKKRAKMTKGMFGAFMEEYKKASK